MDIDVEEKYKEAEKRGREEEVEEDILTHVRIIIMNDVLSFK